MIDLERYYCIGCGLSKRRVFMEKIIDKTGICNECAEEISRTKDMTFEGKEFTDIVISPFLYVGVVAEIVRNFKFGGQKHYGSFLTEMSFDYFKDTALFDGYDLIVPVPLHENRLKERGFNQSDIIAEKLRKMIDTKVNFTALKRIRDTLHQSSLKGSDRIKNVKDAFLAEDESLAGKKIILADDIYTMGETTNECAKALRAAGAQKVAVFTLCKTLIKKKHLF